MHCPRCATSSPADRLYCPACHWQLSQPFVSGAQTNGRGHTFSSNSASAFEVTAQVPPAPDPFILTPPEPPKWNRSLRRRGRGRQPRKWSRGHAGGVARSPMPEQARSPRDGRRWEAPARLEVLEMPLVQAAFDFPSSEDDAERLAAQAAAPVGVRMKAGLMDATLILLAGGVFFGMFALLGGELGASRHDLLIYLVATFALATAYFGLFTLLGGRTPGMQYHRLRVVSFEGKPMTPTQARLRAVGYVVSGGSLLLGFLWAWVDERRLTWHDHISRTFLTDRTVL